MATYVVDPRVTSNPTTRGDSHFADGTEETSRAGDMYFWPGGHTGWTDEGVTFIELSPAEDLRPVLEHLAAKLSPSA